MRQVKSRNRRKSRKYRKSRKLRGGIPQVQFPHSVVLKFPFGYLDDGVANPDAEGEWNRIDINALPQPLKDTALRYLRDEFPTDVATVCGGGADSFSAPVASINVAENVFELRLNSRYGADIVDPCISTVEDRSLYQNPSPAWGEPNPYPRYKFKTVTRTWEIQ